MSHSSSHPMGVSNAEIAAALDEVADLLETQQANPFRIEAYRNGARTVRGLHDGACDILRSAGVTGLVQLPEIGESLARSIEQLCQTGRLPLLDRLRGDNVVESLFSSIPGIGSQLAERIHEQLGVETLAELDAAARDGSLERVPGIGRRRAQAIREVLAGRYRRPLATSPPWQASADAVPVAELLDIDAEYRRKAAAGRLLQIAPRKFNPTNAAWLPILHTSRGDRLYTALYSNTARAHELGTTHDWVVIYRDDATDGRWTVITSQFSDLKGKRIVRGREDDCRKFYAALASRDLTTHNVRKNS